MSPSSQKEVVHQATELQNVNRRTFLKWKNYRKSPFLSIPRQIINTSKPIFSKYKKPQNEIQTKQNSVAVE